MSCSRIRTFVLGLIGGIAGDRHIANSISFKVVESSIMMMIDDGVSFLSLQFFVCLESWHFEMCLSTFQALSMIL